MCLDAFDEYSDTFSINIALKCPLPSLSFVHVSTKNNCTSTAFCLIKRVTYVYIFSSIELALYQ